jgi:sec-independent protein translocase protein TatA
MFGSLGWQELLIVLVILALVFGASRVADLGGALGKGIREFRSEAGGGDKDKDKDKAPTAVADKPAADADKTG